MNTFFFAPIYVTIQHSSPLTTSPSPSLHNHRHLMICVVTLTSFLFMHSILIISYLLIFDFNELFDKTESHTHCFGVLVCWSSVISEDDLLLTWIDKVSKTIPSYPILVILYLYDEPLLHDSSIWNFSQKLNCCWCAENCLLKKKKKSYVCFSTLKREQSYIKEKYKLTYWYWI